MGDSLVDKLRTSPEDRIVDLLKRIHERRGRSAQRAPAGAQTAIPSSSDSYDRARRLFSAREQQLRQQEGLADVLIGELRQRGQKADAPLPRAAGAPSQETLYLRAAIGAPAGARFRVANRRAAAAEVALEASRLRVVGSDVTLDCSLDLMPARFRLEPGEDRTVRLRADLALAAGLRPGDRLEAAVHASGEGEPLHQLWIEVEVYAL